MADGFPALPRNLLPASPHELPREALSAREGMRKLISERWNEFSESILEEAVRRGSCAIVEQYRPEMDEGPLEKIGYAAAEFYLDSLVLYVFGGRIRY